MVAICSVFLNSGFCPHINTCPKRHDLPMCTDCHVVCTNVRALKQHLCGRLHRRQLAGETVSLNCSICRIYLVGQTAWRQHVSSKRHRLNAQTRGVSVDVEPVEAGEGVAAHKFCALCKTYVRTGSWAHHSSSKIHKRTLRFSAIEAALEEASKDKHGITVVPNALDFGCCETVDAKNGLSLEISIQNVVPLSDVALVQVKLSSTASKRASPYTFVISGSERRVIHSKALTVIVEFKHAHVGMYHDRLELLFRDTKLNQQFLIARSLKAIVGNPAEYAALQPKAPFVPRERSARDPERDIVPGDPPPALNVIKYVVKLAQYPISSMISDTLNHRGSLESIIGQFRASVLPSILNESTYGRFYKVLLWAEEHRSERDMEIYDIASATLNRHESYYYLDVPGLAEKRPSVLVGDRILIQPVGNEVEKGKWFEGCVHVVRRESVGMRFHGSFQSTYSPAQLYRARFKLNRTPLRRQHQALDTAFSPQRLLFSNARMHLQGTIPATNIICSVLYNGAISNNPPQLQAVASVTQLRPGAPPFIIFGPPGTGKTVTTVECILQILRLNPRAHILACAPSNSAADLMAQRLTMLTPDEMFRFYAPSRFKSQVPDNLLPYTATTDFGHFTAPPVSRLKQFRVIVSTCVSASFAYGVGMPRGHFSHIFVDEAGQATEPEVMIAIKTMADNETNVVLSGDPRQLGPIIRSPVARELGLEKSYLERMMDNVQVYEEKRGYGLTVVKLVQNFRSHQAILKFPNDRFYSGDLQSCGDPTVINSYVGSSLLPNPKFPIIFHASSGKDDREMSSPSFFNAIEALIVKEYVEKLRSNRSVRIADTDIGVIAPYHAQCRRIRSILKPVADGVKVGSVEEFQGQERRVILISTVRSSREFVTFDLRHTLGFVANPRRLNVAVTRAKSLLIIVGDPTVLSLDPLWRAFLNYIYNNGGWKGEGPVWDTNAPIVENGNYEEEIRELGLADMNLLARKLESYAHDEASEEAEEDNVDRPWRDLE